MISILPKTLAWKAVSSYYETGKLFVRNYSVLNNMTESDWTIAKSKLEKLSLEERRKLYKINDYVHLDVVDPWFFHVLKTKTIRTKKHTLDDVTEFKKYKINAALNEELAKKVSIFKGDITKLEVSCFKYLFVSFFRYGIGN